MIWFLVLALGVVTLSLLAYYLNACNLEIAIFAFPLGLVVFGAGWLVMALVNVSWEAWMLWVWLGLIGATSFWNREVLLQWMNEAKSRVASFNKWQWLLIGLILFEGAAFWVVQGSHNYIHADGMTHWYGKAKVLYEDSGIRPATLTDPAYRQPPSGGAEEVGAYFRAKYPPFVPAILAGAATLMGQFSIASLKWVWFGLHASVLFTWFYIGKRVLQLSTFRSLVLVFLYQLIPAVSIQFSVHWFGLADFWSGAYLLFALVLILKAMEGKSSLSWVLAGIFISVMPLIKNDGIIGFFLLPALMMSFREKEWVKKILILLAVFLPFILWRAALSTWPQYVEEQDYIVSNLLDLDYLLKRLPQLGGALLSHMGKWRLFNLGWVLYGAHLFYVLKQGLNRRQLWLEIPVFLMMVFFWLILSASPLRVDVLESRAGVVDRLLLQLMPVALLLSINSFKELLKTPR